MHTKSLGFNNVNSPPPYTHPPIIYRSDTLSPAPDTARPQVILKPFKTPCKSLVTLAMSNYTPITTKPTQGIYSGITANSTRSKIKIKGITILQAIPFYYVLIHCHTVASFGVLTDLKVSQP